MTKRKTIYCKEFYIFLAGVSTLGWATALGNLSLETINSPEFPNKKLVIFTILLTILAINYFIGVLIMIHDFIVEVAPRFVGNSDE